LRARRAPHGRHGLPPRRPTQGRGDRAVVGKSAPRKRVRLHRGEDRMSDGSVRDWSRERWRKLYLVESLHKNSWPLMARALEAYLVKRARDDGFLARTPDELLSALNPTSIERGDTQEAIHVLLDDGFLDVRPEG